MKIIADFMNELTIAGNEPVVIGGDFNIDAREVYERQNIANILKVIGPPREGYGYTDPSGYYPTSPSGQVLDYVFYSASHPILVYAINQVRQPMDDAGQDLSDHYAVLGSFIFP